MKQEVIDTSFFREGQVFSVFMCDYLQLLYVSYKYRKLPVIKQKNI